MRPADRVAGTQRPIVDRADCSNHGLSCPLRAGKAGRLQHRSGDLQPAVEDPQGNLPGGRRNTGHRHHSDY